MLHVEIIAGNAIVKLAFRDIHFGRFLPKGEDERPEFGLGNGQDVVREKECANTDERHGYDERTHDAEKRYSGRFHGGQFKPFAHVSKGHQRSQQDGKRKGQRHHRTERIDKKLRQNRQLNTLPHKVLHVHPHKLHKQDQGANEERHQEKPKKTLEHIKVEFFQTKIHFFRRAI